jgi:hypothetical protein
MTILYCNVLLKFTFLYITIKNIHLIKKNRFFVTVLLYYYIRIFFNATNFKINLYLFKNVCMAPDQRIFISSITSHF